MSVQVDICVHVCDCQRQPYVSLPETVSPSSKTELLIGLELTHQTTLAGQLAPGAACPLRSDTG